MTTLWYLILVFLLAGYVILDGFDLGVGALYLWAGRTDEERRTMLNAIGPVWDGNEVWLITFGAALFLSFPRVYAAAFSGFYLALIIALWLLMGRGVSLEFRGRLANSLWSQAFNVVFSLSSAALAIVYGVALGNVISGVPLNAQGYYQGLFAWMLNPYALLMGLFSLVLLTLHGAYYLVWKTTGVVQDRARRAAARLWWLVIALIIVTTPATFLVRPGLADNFRSFPPYVLVPLAAIPLLAVLRIYLRRGQDFRAFLSSAGLISALGAATTIGLYPYLLPSSPHPARGFTIYNAAASSGSLFPGLIWMSFGLVFIIAYTIIVYRIFKGKVVLEPSSHY